MTKFRIPTAVLALSVLLVALAFAQTEVPALAGRVNDYARLLDARQTQQIEDALARFESETTNQVALLTVPSLKGDSIEGFSIRAAEKWKIGQKSRDNGVLLIVAPNERKVRIEVGYGLEGALTDALSSRIIRDVLVPAFKTGNYYAGIAGGLDAIMKATQGEFKAPKENAGYAREVNKKSASALSTIFMIIVFLFLIFTRTGRFILFTSMLFGGRGGRGGGFSGGGFSGGGGGFGGGGASGSW